MPTPAVRNNNPGNIKDPKTGTFRQFATSQEGYAALLNDLQAKQQGTTTTGLGPSSTLVDFASKYAPANDKNNVGQYAANLANKIGARPDTQLSKLDLAKWAAAVADNEDKSSPFAGQKILSTKYNPKPFSNPSPGQFDFTGTVPSQAPQQTGPVGELNTALSGRLNDVGGALNVGGKGVTDIAKGNVVQGAGHLVSSALQGAGAVAGGVGDVIGAGLGLIPGVKQAEELVGKGISKVAQTNTGQKVIKGVSDWSAQNPELSKDIGAVGNIAGLFGGGVGGKFAKDTVKEGVLGAAREGLLGAGIKNVAEKKALTDAAEILGSKPTKNEVKSAVRSGKATVQGGVPGITADPLKEKSISHVANLVKEGKASPKNLATKNAQVIKHEADTEAESMLSAVKNQEIQPTLQPERLTQLKDNVIQRAGESLVTGEKPAEKLLGEFYKALPKGKEIVAEDVLKARQAVYRYMEANRGDFSIRGVLTGYKSARNAIIDESRNLLKELAPGVDIEGSLAKQTALYRALDYIVPNVKNELGTTRFGRFSQRHPILKGLLKLGGKAATEGLVGGEIIKNVIK